MPWPRDARMSRTSLSPSADRLHAQQWPAQAAAHRPCGLRSRLPQMEPPALAVALGTESKQAPHQPLITSRT
eukprot:4452356-Alexandrium_andersonii.AAC.1